MSAHILLENCRNPRYFLTCERGEMPVYGIAAFRGKTAVDKILDYDTDKDFVLTLVRKLNTGRAQLCHFKEILEDELNARI